ncbi:hypothetical protein Pth03_09280 [Planotetraspora thailandica]|uniref:Uncharacterized protein n=1 Tax=Planotetraspora thailandica TaxID=487172 RepID=A0A8J3UV35_9ACTN|nr:hypothetical protein [Planotetraspora thailandica]GII52539.1 hypothetical protein Pth03_09280 [Planotetraspora thailandica]
MSVQTSVRVIRRVVGFDVKGTAALALWALRRRHGVPPGATAVPYAREQMPTLMIVLFVLVVEAAVMEILLRGLGVPEAVRVPVLVVDVYAVFAGLAAAAACVTRPHVVTAEELRVRYGAFFDLRVPRELISSVRLARRDDEPGVVTVRDGRLGVAVSSRTNVVVELAGPVTAVRPLGRREDVTTIRLFADDPRAAVAVLNSEVRDLPHGA